MFPILVYVAGELLKHSNRILSRTVTPPVVPTLLSYTMDMLELPMTRQSEMVTCACLIWVESTAVMPLILHAHFLPMENSLKIRKSSTMLY